MENETLIIQECQQFMKLRSAFKKEDNPPNGSVGYLISLQWVRNYKDYLQYDALKNREKPRFGSHTKPGPVTNADFLETDAAFLVGTGQNSEKQQEPEVIDRYIKEGAMENRDYEVVSQDIWTFVSQLYGYDLEVRRYYYKGQWQYSSTLEVSMKLVPLVLMMTSSLKSPVDLQPLCKHVQVRKSATWSDLRKRICDCLAQLTKNVIKVEDVRLWSVPTDGDQVLASLEAVAACKNWAMEQDQGTELNSGVECPGNSSLDPYFGTSMTVEEKTFLDEAILVEVANQNQFAFKFTKQERVFFGKCEWCTKNRLLAIICKCKRVRYCNESCLENDKRWHVPKCGAQMDSELNEVQMEMSDSGKKGIVGLSNLGNTCYMNSSLQCLSNTYELTKYFLDQKFKFILDLEVKNPLGTEGRLVMAYAKTLNQMWNMESPVVTPDMFKKILGQYAPQFQGYGQHDSHECINTILDLLGEDLYRKGKKPYIDMDEEEGLSQHQAALDSWNRHLYRNESIITDLFHGQFKSTVSCSKCPRVSVTFDPMMTMSLPIPSKKQKVNFYYVPYDIKNNYVNYSGELMLRTTDTFSDLRTLFQKKYQYDHASFTVSRVESNTFMKYYNQNTTIDRFTGQSGGFLLLYEIPNALNPTLSTSSATDNNNGIDTHTRLIVNHSHMRKQEYSQRLSKESMLPRIMWVRKDMTLNELHREVFLYFKYVIAEWIDWKDPNTTKTPRDPKIDLRKLLPQFHIDVTKEEFLNSDMYDKLFTKRDVDSDSSWKIEEMPYRLCFKDVSGYYESCKYCGQMRCNGCPVAYKDMTINEILDSFKIDYNDTLFSDERIVAGKEFQVEVVWHQDLHQSLFSFLTTAVPMPALNVDEADGQVLLTDCLKEFKQLETLDQDNMWYCKMCKEHVQATKTLEIYKLPRIMIISLKRFKSSKSKYGGMGFGGQKIDTLVEFPLEGLDMTPFVLCQEQKEHQLIYDLFAVSNHYGGVGGGHYTAFGQNPLNKQWYSFNDSSCQPAQTSRIVSEGAYNLFYRLREYKDLAQIDLDAFHQEASSEFLKKLKDHQEAKVKK